DSNSVEDDGIEDNSAKDDILDNDSIKDDSVDLNISAYDHLSTDTKQDAWFTAS
ncbi:14678_t:CDS:1, partial [Gigaspora rosea]